MTNQAKLYLIIVNDKGEKCIFLTPKEISKLKPIKPEIVYDGGDHAILYRNTQETIILDYIPQPQRDINKLSEILVVEYDVKNKVIVNEYMAKITSTKTIPDISKILEKK